MTECVQVAGWIAQAVNFPVMMDGDTGHGGVMAVRRMIRECIRAGIAGIRIDDQPIEGKRKTQSAGMEVVPIEQAIARYRAAVDMKNDSIRASSSWRSVTHGMQLTAASRTCCAGSRLTGKRRVWIGCSSNRRIQSRRSSARARRWKVRFHS